MKETTALRPAQDEPANDESPAVRTVIDALRGLQFGSVTLVVQDGVIVQVERLEKKRLARPARV
jgi:hypothetical protein